MQQQKAVAAAPIYIQRRVQRDEALPRVELTPQQGDERVRATVAFEVGLGGYMAVYIRKRTSPTQRAI